MRPVVQPTQKTRVIDGVAPDAVPYDELVAAEQPVIIRGLVRDWPLVRIASAGQAAAYIKSFYRGRRIVAFVARPELKGRFGYTPDATRLDFESDRGLLDEYLDRILAHLDDDNAPSIYIGSTDVDTYLPGFRAENDLVLNHAMFEANPPLVGAWIGNRTTALAHHDMSHNIACCLVGRRRFTLFPPEQVENLYPGPLEPTPGGQVVTMADISAPDFERFPDCARRWRRAGRRAGTGRRALLPGHVVAPGRRTRAFQRHDQLLVEHVATRTWTRRRTRCCTRC